MYILSMCIYINCTYIGPGTLGHLSRLESCAHPMEDRGKTMVVTNHTNITGVGKGKS